MKKGHLICSMNAPKFDADVLAGRHVWILVFVCCLLAPQGEAMTALTREEDSEIEQQLKRLNKPAIKTIRTEHGDVYACVDFYKQPAFDHPLLKNHSYHFQMKPKSSPANYKSVRTEKSSADEKVMINVEPTRVNCPYGTVPIRRITKDELIRAKLQQSQAFSSKNNYEPETAEKHGLHLAIVRTKYNASKKYNGGGMRVTIENPHTEASQYSLARMEVGNGPDALQVGSMVNPDVYGDNRTRGFISFRTTGSSCFNTLCSGFTLVSHEIPIDGILEPISVPGKIVYLYEAIIYREEYSGNWWVELGSQHVQIGFWPKRMFRNLRELANYVEWGGEVFGPPEKPSPAMGRGRWLDHYLLSDAFIDRMTTINESDHEIVDVPKEIQTYCDTDRKIYEVSDAGYDRSSNHQRYMYYGGRGGITGY